MQGGLFRILITPIAHSRATRSRTTERWWHDRNGYAILGGMEENNQQQPPAPETPGSNAPQQQEQTQYAPTQQYAQYSQPAPSEYTYGQGSTPYQNTYQAPNRSNRHLPSPATSRRANTSTSRRTNSPTSSSTSSNTRVRRATPIRRPPARDTATSARNPRSPQAYWAFSSDASVRTTSISATPAKRSHSC